MTFGGHVPRARREGSGVPAPGPSPSPTRAFYLVNGTQRDDDVERSRGPNFVSRKRWLVIVDTEQKKKMDEASARVKECTDKLLGKK